MRAKKKNVALRDAKLQEVVRKQRKPGSTKSSTVKRAVKNIKRLQKKKEEDVIPLEVKPKRVKKPVHEVEFKSTRGLIYLGHIPHGFYEKQMQDYFKQFGEVTRVRVARSKNTGRSRGYGYIEFTHPSVAKIAAETMNNYLMCGRLLKATYIPPEKQHVGYFLGENWSEEQYPKLRNREKTIRIKNAKVGGMSHEKFLTRTKRNLTRLQKKLKEKGIDIKLQSTKESTPKT